MNSEYFWIVMTSSMNPNDLYSRSVSGFTIASVLNPSSRAPLRICNAECDPNVAMV